MSINNKLLNFAQHQLVIGYNAIERENIKTSLYQLEKILHDKLKGELRDLMKFGSFTRNTILPRKYDPNTDVDLMVIFNTGINKFTPGTYREKILRIVSNAYPNSISKKDFPSIKLELNHIMFDLVPAYLDEYSWSKTYHIPGSGDSWRETTPNDINEELGKMNKSYGDNVVRGVIRLCKHWNASANYPFESYLLEKRIVGTFFWWGDNLYEKFLSVLGDVAGDRPGVRQALEYIKQYRNNDNEQRQFEWLQRLLPGLE